MLFCACTVQAQNSIAVELHRPNAQALHTGSRVGPHRLCENCFKVITRRKVGSVTHVSHDHIKECPACSCYIDGYSYMGYMEPVTTQQMDDEVARFESVVPVPEQNKRYMNRIPTRVGFRSWGTIAVDSSENDSDVEKVVVTS
jgi:hypothetical protein